MNQVFPVDDPVWQTLADIDAESSSDLRALAAAARLDPSTDFRDISLAGLSLEKQDLSNFDFSGSDLRGTNIRRASTSVGLKISAATKLDAIDRRWWRRKQRPADPGIMGGPTLAAHPFFKTLDPESCRILDRHCVWLKVSAGNWILGQTQVNNDVFFVMTGHLRAEFRLARRKVILYDLLAGSMCGEMSAFDRLPPEASVFAVTNSLVAKMPGPVFVETAFSFRPLLEGVIATLIARTRARLRSLGDHGRKPSR
jgi:Cyclic nucleotide-binding domain